jgi:hypothetical protein
MNVVGEAIADFVSEQIKVRQKIYGSTNATTRPLAETLFLNQRVAFAKLVSGVDINDVSKLRGDIKNIITSNNLTGNSLASKFILFAGTTERDTANDRNLLSSGITRDGSSINRGAYGLGGLDFGLKPMPGITSIDIKTENRGSLRTANIKIKAWNTTQFDIIDLLYLRLGYSVLLEWGNVSYVDNDGEIEPVNPFSLVDQFLAGGPFQGETPSAIPVTPSLSVGATVINQNIFGTSTNPASNTSTTQSEATITALLDNIALLRKQSAGNYDAFYGKVINFSWSFAEDGSYDIDLELRSVGDVVESLKMNVLINDKTTQGEQQEEETDELETIQDYKDKNQFGRFFYNTIKKLNENKNFLILDVPGKNNNTVKIGTGNFFLPQEKVNFMGQVFRGELLSSDVTGEADSALYYIRFGALLYFIQNNILPVYRNGNSQTPLLYVDYDTDTNLAYFNSFQLSADPRICVINTAINGVYDNNPEVWYYAPAGEPYVTDIGGVKVGQIMNIYVNMFHVLQLVDNNTTNKEIALIDLLTDLCSDISLALGGINSFEPFIDEDTIRIIDQTPLAGKDLILPKLGKKLIKDTTTIQLYGYKATENPETKARSFQGNFVRNYGIKTELTNAFATTVTIGAQARGSVVGENSTALSKLNEGLIDRLKPQINDSPGTDENFDSVLFKFATKDPSGNYLNPFNSTPTEEETKLAELEKKYSTATKDYFKFARAICSTILQPRPVYIENQLNTYTSVLTNFLTYLESRTAILENKSSGTEGFLPVSIELTLDGISGIKIYNGLNLDTRFLPSNYPETMDFLVTSLNHKIDNNVWTTSLGTVMVPNNTSQSGGTYIITTTGLRLGSTTLGFDNSTIDDPAPRINPNRIGATSYNNSFLAQSLASKNYKNASIPDKELVNINFAKGGQNRKLHPSAAAALKSWVTELEANRISYRISSAYRDYKQQAGLAKNQNNAASAGSSPHGWGGAVDFGNLYQFVKGSTNPRINLDGRISVSTNYESIATIGAKYGWYNPWRLSDNRGVDEIWHFEYWGPVNS